MAACGGGGGGGGDTGDGTGGGSLSRGIGLEDMNGDGQIVILAFGDSITRGVGDGPGAESTPPASVAGYPARLQPQLAPRTTLPLVVVNDGNAGERTRTGVSRLRRDLGRTPADYVILLEGTNDIQDGDLDGAVDRMQTMIDNVFAVGARPLLGTIPPSCCAHKNAVSFGAEEAYNNQLHGLASTYMVPIIEFYSAFTGGDDVPYDSTLGLIHEPEGLHPTPAGYDVMAAAAASVF